MKKMTCGLVQFFLMSQSLYAQGGIEEAPHGDGGLIQTLVMVSIALLFFYFILWRPEQKRRKALEEQRSSLKKGDRVTAMGIIGTVLRIQEQTVILKMYDGSKLEFLKGAITEVLSGTEEEVKKVEKEESTVPKKVEALEPE